MEDERVDGLGKRWPFNFLKFSIYKTTILLCFHLMSQQQISYGSLYF